MPDNTKHDLIAESLFRTGALKVCPDGKPFWYTSGTIGPYYINTHFLIGGEREADDLLAFIDNNMGDRTKFPDIIREEIRKIYNRKGIYYEVMNCIADCVRDLIDGGYPDFDAILGGERRDWFFSVMLAELLGKPHITFYKDGTAYIPEHLKPKPKIRLFHTADLLNEASSYTKMWIPIAQSAGMEMPGTLVVVDRCQGGREALENEFGIKLYSMIDIGTELFNTAFGMGYVNEAQLKMISEYIRDPRQSMKDFLIRNPEFLRESLEAGSKTAQRARLCIESGIYGPEVYSPIPG